MDMTENTKNSSVSLLKAILGGIPATSLRSCGEEIITNDRITNILGDVASPERVATANFTC